MEKVKTRVFAILEVGKPGDKWSRAFDIFIVSLITLNTFAVILESVESIYEQYHVIFNGFEYFSITIFSIEYILRLWSCTVDPSHKHPIFGRLRFALKPLLIIDLIAILPFFLPLLLPFDLRTFRIIRLFRIFRILKLARYTEALKIFVKVLKEKKEELLLSMIIIFISSVIVSTVVYFFEKNVQPHNFSNIPDALWWALITLTTVGYGDMYPLTLLGKFFATILALLGIALFALPAGIIASGFVDEIQKKKDNQITCPHCGKNITLNQRIF
ncbi:MAG: ion transporter [Ignavibacteria bacterium]|nr:ion transporter [Ignavibacteria bacterium]